MKASPSLLSKTRLFTSWQQIGLSLGLLFLVFCSSLFLEYQAYKKITEFNDYTSTVWVEKQYKKNDKWVLKLKSTEGFSLYTTSTEDLRPLLGYFLDIKMFTEGLTFISYLRGFYSPTVLLSRNQLRQERYMLMDKLEEVHQSSNASLFKALFFAAPLDKSLRNQLSALGINHLLAISGFHLGVLGFILFFIFRSVYQPIQERFFPYRNAHRDMSVLVLAVLFSYLYFLDFVPSLLRAFAMSLFAYLLYDRGMKILSFSSLFMVVMFLISLWPKLLFVLGFWLSVAGVFYIFLFLHHMKELKAWQSFVMLHLWVYLAMLPIVHVFFGTFSLYQLYSPLLTMLFIIFYPAELFLHFIAQGDSLDTFIDHLINLQINTIEVFLPLWSLFVYILFSVLAVFHKLFFNLILFFDLGLLCHFLYRVTEL